MFDISFTCNSTKKILVVAIFCAGTISCSVQKPKEPRTVGEISNSARESIVLINYPSGTTGHGSGFFVEGDAEKCTVLSAAHVTKPSKILNLSQENKGIIATTSEISIIPNTDLAVITFDPPSGGSCPYKSLTLGNANQVTLGSGLVIMGYPNREGESKLVLQSVTGKVTAVEDPPLIEGYSISYDATTIQGMSGGPVLNAYGEVVAIHGKTDLDLMNMASKQSKSLSEAQEAQLKVVDVRTISTSVELHFKWGIPINEYLSWRGSQPPEVTPKAEPISPTISVPKETKKKGFSFPWFKKKTSEDWYRKGVSLLSDKKTYPKALKAFEKATKLDPQYYDAWVSRCEMSRIVEQNNKNTSKICNTSISLIPDFATATERCDTLFQNNRLEEAQDVCNRSAELVASYKLAEDRCDTLIVAGRKGSAEPMCNRSIALIKDYNSAIARCDFLINDKNRTSEADKACKKSIALIPEEYNVVVQRCDFLTLKNRQAEATQICDKLLLLFPNASTASERCSELLDQEKLTDALKVCNKAVEIQKSYDTYYKVCKVKFGLGNYNESISLCDQAIELDSKQYGAWKIRGDASFHLEEFDVAIKNYDAALDANPRSSDALLGKCQAFLKLKEHTNAQKSCEEARSISTSNPDIWLSLGESYFKYPDPINSLYCDNKYKDSDGNFDYPESFEDYEDQAKWSRAYYSCLNEYGYRHAIAMLDKALSLTQDKSKRSYAWEYKAYSYQKLGLLYEALSCLDSAITNLPNSELWNTKGDILREVGKRLEAVEAYKKALELDSGNKQAESSLDSLRSELGQKN